MSRVCELTGTRSMYGNKVSHSNRKSRTRWNANLKSKKFLISELDQSVTLYVTASAIRTIDKIGGFVPALLKAKSEKLSPRLLKIRAQILKKRQTTSAKAKTA